MQSFVRIVCHTKHILNQIGIKTLRIGFVIFLKKALCLVTGYSKLLVVTKFLRAAIFLQYDYDYL